MVIAVSFDRAQLLAVWVGAISLGALAASAPLSVVRRAIVAPIAPPLIHAVALAAL